MSEPFHRKEYDGWPPWWLAMLLFLVAYWLFLYGVFTAFGVEINW